MKVGALQTCIVADEQSLICSEESDTVWKDLNKVLKYGVLKFQIQITWHMQYTELSILSFEFEYC